MVKTTNEHKWTRFFNHKTSGATVDRNQIIDYEPLMYTDGHEFFDFLNHEIHENAAVAVALALTMKSCKGYVW